MIAIIHAVKDILLQISAACTFLFLFQWRLDIGHSTRRNRRFPDDQTFFMICCALSITLCMALSTTMFGVVYLNLAILPAYIGILYGNFRSGAYLTIYFIACTALFSVSSGLNQIVLHTGMLLYPLLFGMAKPFKQAGLTHKISMLWGALFPSMLFIVIIPGLHGQSIFEAFDREALLAGAYIVTAVILGALFIVYIETAWDKLQVKERMKGISEKLQRESEKLQQITNVVPLNIMSFDNNGRVSELNEYMLSLIRLHYPQLTREAILSQPAEQVFGSVMDQVTFERLRGILLSRQRTNAKIKLESMTYQVFTAPLQYDSDVPSGIVVIIQDLTEEEKIRSELDNVERLTLVGQMAAGITHEIRNPMAVVRGFLQLMREKSPEDLHSYYHIVMEELDRANSIINDFLSLAQSRVSDKETVQLHLIMEELTPLIWADANLRGQSVELKLSPVMPLLRLNIREIKQLVLNLVRNGMEAMDTKGVLTLSTSVHDDTVQLIISDTGSGIPQSQLQQLFTPFFTTKSQGTGLGLSLCLSIAERHNGTIHVESEVGRGTSVVVTIPIEEKGEITEKSG
ncbi:ATP-binding protein [Paenibacillus sp. MMS20-IR301]|uniref:two-component system sensor histidine kinase NtrB n=1 Tax=Paenibacillus sp. MMS20-IR301 TaxID=2895946 RepID=UPI0028E4BB29|nr:ATP-binding protein [Paenibacillus sp. MMS20-IR301]WNS41668.1 ATP-binding protein [Paenibacillus sp. MMS20-IR301]